jgi:hypothetical protein
MMNVPDFDENPKNRKIKKRGVILLMLKHTPDRSIIYGIETAHRKKHDGATCFFVCVYTGNLCLSVATMARNQKL